MQLFPKDKESKKQITILFSEKIIVCIFLLLIIPASAQIYIKEDTSFHIVDSTAVLIRPSTQKDSISSKGSTKNQIYVAEGTLVTNLEEITVAGCVHDIKTKKIKPKKRRKIRAEIIVKSTHESARKVGKESKAQIYCSYPENKQNFRTDNNITAVVVSSTLFPGKDINGIEIKYRFNLPSSIKTTKNNESYQWTYNYLGIYFIFPIRPPPITV